MCESWAQEDIRLQKRGQIFGFIIAMVAVGGGLYVAVHGAPAAGASISGVPLVGIVAAFLQRRKMGRVEPDEEEKLAEDTTKK